jgi:hypothetical protein
MFHGAKMKAICGETEMQIKEVLQTRWYQRDKERDNV